MKALPFKIPKPTNTAILFQIDRGSFYSKLHQHEEVQVSLIKKGKGTLIVGDTVHHYDTGDIIVLGGQQPHVFRNEDDQGLMYTVFFSLSSFGNTFLSLEEGRGIKEFYAFAKAGFKLPATPDLHALFNYLSTAKGIHKLSYFLQLIAVLKVSRAVSLSNFVYERKISEIEGQKLNAIFDYTLAHYANSVYLKDVAALATMTPNAFCKFFKKRTNKTYFQFLTDVRIEKACKQLREEMDLPIIEIAERSGFSTPSHFNRKFKELKKMSPREYRKTTI